MITVNVDCFVWLNVYPFCNSRTPSWRARSIVNLPNSCSIDLQAYGSQNTRLLGRLQPKKQVNLTICWGERQRRKLQGDVLWRLTVTKKKLFVTIKYFLWSCQISWTQLLFCFWSIHIGNPVAGIFTSFLSSQMLFSLGKWVKEGRLSVSFFTS